MKCPECGTECEPYAEVDIGVGTMQGGPWGCPACHWVEPDDDSLKPDQWVQDGKVFEEDADRCRNMAHKRYNMFGCPECSK